jgi:hypothetical protein
VAIEQTNPKLTEEHYGLQRRKAFRLSAAFVPLRKLAGRGSGNHNLFRRS